MDSCIFCKIIKGEIPCHKAYEDDDFLVFLDAFPIATGHTLLVTKKHYDWVWDLEEEKYSVLMSLAKKIALALKTAFNAEFVSEAIVGVEVKHAHMHLVPNALPVGDKLSPGPTDEEFRQTAETIKRFL